MSQIMRRFDEESILDLGIFQKKSFEFGGLKPVDPGWDDRLGRIDVSCLLGEAKQVTRPMESDDLSFAIAERMADPDQPRGQQVNETRLVALRENQRAGGPEVDDLRQPPEFSPFRCRERDMRRLFTVPVRPAMGRPYANVGVSAAARMAQSRHGQVSASPGRGLGKRLSALV